jgi:hypothetical protein
MAKREEVSEMGLLSFVRRAARPRSGARMGECSESSLLGIFLFVKIVVKCLTLLFCFDTMHRVDFVSGFTD